ncbi:MAG: cobaltochelatase subunit CobN [Parabacteroides distasonis]
MVLRQTQAVIHFGTHGKPLGAFTPRRKQVALCSDDWPDRLVGALPHLYIFYRQRGEGGCDKAKRRPYATWQSYS